jgi:drug/metabolite transporter (DMT)-like permease
VTAVGFGVLTAVMWGLGALISVRQVQQLGAGGSLLWMMALGFLLVSPALAFVEVPEAPTSTWVYAALSGVGYVVGTAFWFLAVRRGRISVLTPIVSTDGAVAAVIAIAAFGETVSRGVGLALVVIVAGIVVTSLHSSHVQDGRSSTAAIPFAIGAALGYGFSFVAAGQAVDLGTVWAIWMSRLAAVALVVPAAFALRFAVLPRRSSLLLPLAVALTDIAGFAAFLRGSSSSVAVTSVLASQYAVVAVLGGILVYRERLSPLQVGGIALTLAGVGALAFLRA